MKSLTVRRVVNAFFRWAESALSPKTVSAYRHQLTKFLRNVGNKRVARLRPADVSSWARSWHEVQAVVRLFNWARDEARLLKVNPFTAIRKPPRGQRRRILASRGLVELLRAARPAARSFLLALRETLARPQEIRAAGLEQLQAEDIDTPLDVALRMGRALIVQPDWKDARRRKDQTRSRVLLVSKRLGRAILRIHPAPAGKVGPIWLNTLGHAWSKNAVRCLMRRLRRKLGIAKDVRGEHVVAYTFRHSLATFAAAHGVQDRLLADLLGHVETRTTNRYTHLSVAHLRAAIARLDRARRQQTVAG